ncbi:hypothetical protein GCM10025876_08270 [Demequina litorisediminis]|uniref:Uncharacterized protein n=1 Tax=Demequina litorisediminis TaxID=1849022 RepID=A0ABQ6ID10_9MICO|nr:hypothetical protein GCM10025876_08270 [Demequina litorisediminis]
MHPVTVTWSQVLPWSVAAPMRECPILLRPQRESGASSAAGETDSRTQSEMSSLRAVTPSRLTPVRSQPLKAAAPRSRPANDRPDRSRSSQRGPSSRSYSSARASRPKVTGMVRGAAGEAMGPPYETAHPVGFSQKGE